MTDNSTDVTEFKPRKTKSIKELKKSNQPETDKPAPPPKPPIATLYAAISNVINRYNPLFSSPSPFPEFPERFLVYEPERGIYRYLLLEADDKVSFVNDDYIINSITKYTSEKLHYLQSYQWTHSQCEGCFKYWGAITNSIQEEIPAVRWKDEPGKTFKRLPWNKPVAPYDTSLANSPIFKEMMDRIPNHKALMMWIGSLFDMTSSNHQYIWVVGAGGDGKGALLEFLSCVLDNSFSLEGVPSDGDKFWASTIINKRLIAFDDCEKASFVTSDFFKRLTGNGLIKVEEKFKAAYMARFKGKFIFTSQRKPRISDEKANLRRLIYCTIDPITVDPRRTYAEELKAEGAPFLEACVGLYEEWKEANPVAANLPTLTDGLDQVLAEADEQYETFFANYLESSPGSNLSATQLFPKLVEHFNSNTNINKAKAYLAKAYGIEFIKTRSHGKQFWVYTNVRMKTGVVGTW